MIVHVVLFRPKADLTPGARAALIDSLSAAARDVPAIGRVRVGRRIRHGRQGYEQAMGEDYEYLLMVEFDDLHGLTRYLEHPAHDEIGRHFTQSSAAALAYDYQLVELDELPR